MYEEISNFNEYPHVDFESKTISGWHLDENYDEGCDYHVLKKIVNFKIPHGEIHNFKDPFDHDN